MGDIDILNHFGNGKKQLLEAPLTAAGGRLRLSDLVQFGILELDP